MFNGGWIKHVTLGLIPIVVALIWAAFYVGSQIGESRGEGNKHTAEYERHAEKKIRATCLSGQGGDIAECVAKVIRSTNEHQRAQDDLVAQTEMARWAFYMLVATVVVAVITGAGVYYVWRTLSITREIGEAQTRAYLTLEDANLRVSYEADQSTTLEFTGKVTNTGQSPASAVESNYKFHVFDAGENTAKISIRDFDSAGSYGL